MIGLNEPGTIRDFASARLHYLSLLSAIPSSERRDAKIAKLEAMTDAEYDDAIEAAQIKYDHETQGLARGPIFSHGPFRSY